MTRCGKVMGMLDEATKTKMRDPAYFALHTQAVCAIRAAGQFAWYDSNFLRRFEAAKLYLAEVRPHALQRFIEGFEPVRPPLDFQVQEVVDLFDEETRERILAIARAAKPGGSKQDMAEAEDFGRTVIWDDPYLLELQAALLDRMSQIAGRPLATGYNFLSLYGGSGRCEPHMDEPYSMYTLDYCIEQSDDWPIHFSKPVDWPGIEEAKGWNAEALKADSAMAFEPKILKPNQAVFFSGSSQWHYRDPITPGGFCSLLFLHYYPAGCEGLVSPHKWADHFSLPELAPLCDLFGDENTLEVG